ncbi:DNA-3-methyladenine glycosylase I [Mycetohabitans sp. B8]|uniref:DNA-3-methyladenine glycosylase I n=1 Tax=Mycetohabitans sp. B8 TaxID=2841845 RepID=UPI001F1D8635|nr:DNA-3-methyladenine glycosylase I [Mycetohabitans sp. B8]
MTHPFVSAPAILAGPSVVPAPTLAPLRRCHWCGTGAEYCAYHDTEWGFPVDDDRRLFEKLCLEGFQAGLSWLTILRKREAFRAAFANFDIEKVARFTDCDVQRLLGDTGIIRHRGKIEAAIHNARRALALLDSERSLAAYLWRFEPDPRSRPRQLTRDVLGTMTTSPESIALAKDLKRRGWQFVGPTTMYAMMQAMGLVNDHQHDCSVRADVNRARAAFQVPR